MDYFTAQSELLNYPDFISPDFYRVMGKNDIALGLHDKDAAILTDVINHGSEEAHALLTQCLNNNVVIPVTEDNQTYYCINNIVDESIQVSQFYSHLAMQIAYPGEYKEFFGGENVWRYTDPRIQKLLELTMEALTDNTKSDFFKERFPPAEQPKEQASASYKQWVEDCRDHKQQLSALWQICVAATANRKLSLIEWDNWKEEQLAPLEEQIREIKAKHQKAVKELNASVQKAYAAHAALKAQGKPKRG